MAHRRSARAKRDPIPRMDAPKPAPPVDIKFERLPDVDWRRQIVDMCPSCGAFSPLYAPPRAPSRRQWPTNPTAQQNAPYASSRDAQGATGATGGTTPGGDAEKRAPCVHWVGACATVDEARALLSARGGVARARHATTEDGRPRRDGADTRWRCWRTEDTTMRTMGTMRDTPGQARGPRPQAMDTTTTEAAR